MKVRLNIIGLVACASVLGLVGCGGGGGKTVTFHYDRPAQIEVPKEIRKLAVADFDAIDRNDRTYADMAADKVTAGLDDFNRKFKRYTLVDRRNIKAIMDAHDLANALVSDNDTAKKVGKLANVDAMIYGKVTQATHRDDHLTETVVDPLSRSTRDKPYIRRTCQISISFTLDDIQTGKTLYTHAYSRSYDSNEDPANKPSAMSVVGFAAKKLPSAEQKLTELTEECVTEFLAAISPHEEVVSEQLQAGKSKGVKDGNELAAAGEYAEALIAYQQALAEKPDDDGAMFNAGLMCEGLKDFKKAAQYYGQAKGVKMNRTYVTAFKRVSGESANGAAGKDKDSTPDKSDPGKDN